MIDGTAVPAQGFAHELMADGFAGLLIRGCAKGASRTGVYIVLWRWAGAGCWLEAVDDEGRQGTMGMRRDREITSQPLVPTHWRTAACA